MPRLLLLLFAAFAAWYIWHTLKSMNAAERKKAIRSWGLALVLVATVLLVAMGKMHWVGAAIAAAVTLFKVLASFGIRAFPFLKMWQRNTGKPSRIRTAGLEVTFNFASGEMDGTLFKGPYAGSSLNSLDEDSLNQQFAFFQGSDRQSALLLKSYLIKRGFSGYGPNQGDYGQPGSLTAGNITKDEALQILGLEPGASQEEIIRAHRRLIQKLHPDRGGNDYLAAKINSAKDTLLG
ncbi:MAG: hypothetical protein VR73_13965 [Gammaproteobacteria bacterium BRH_c0]|nr:MAG: hypothetical protein VR73_13965 [Gammaproteobacteria bacterium BRH_c0]